MEPKFKKGQRVKFIFNDEEMIGVIEVVDAWGDYLPRDGVSYDIFSGDCLYKHVDEFSVLGSLSDDNAEKRINLFTKMFKKH